MFCTVSFYVLFHGCVLKDNHKLIEHFPSYFYNMNAKNNNTLYHLNCAGNLHISSYYEQHKLMNEMNLAIEADFSHERQYDTSWDIWNSKKYCLLCFYLLELCECVWSFNVCKWSLNTLHTIWIYILICSLHFTIADQARFSTYLKE